MSFLRAIPLIIIGTFSLVLVFAGYTGIENAMDSTQPDALNPLLVQDGERTAAGTLVQPLLGLSIILTLFSFGCLVFIQARRGQTGQTGRGR